MAEAHRAELALLDRPGGGLIVRLDFPLPAIDRPGAGTGLGLAIVERVVTNHGGKLRIRSESGAGTRVTLVLPAERVSAIPLPPGDGRRSNPGEAPA